MFSYDENPPEVQTAIKRGPVENIIGKKSLTNTTIYAPTGGGNEQTKRLKLLLASSVPGTTVRLRPDFCKDSLPSPLASVVKDAVLDRWSVLRETGAVSFSLRREYDSRDKRMKVMDSITFEPGVAQFVSITTAITLLTGYTGAWMLEEVAGERALTSPGAGPRVSEQGLLYQAAEHRAELARRNHELEQQAEEQAALFAKREAEKDKELAALRAALAAQATGEPAVPPAPPEVAEAAPPPSVEATPPASLPKPRR